MTDNTKIRLRYIAVCVTVYTVITALVTAIRWVVM